MNFNETLDSLEENMNFDYVESEGASTVRFDLGDNSFWVHESGEIENLNTFPQALQKKVLSLIKS